MERAKNGQQTRIEAKAILRRRGSTVRPEPDTKDMQADEGAAEVPSAHQPISRRRRPTANQEAQHPTLRRTSRHVHREKHLARCPELSWTPTTPTRPWPPNHGNSATVWWAPLKVARTSVNQGAKEPPPTQKFVIQYRMAHQTGQDQEPSPLHALWRCNQHLAGPDLKCNCGKTGHSYW